MSSQEIELLAMIDWLERIYAWERFARVVVELAPATFTFWERLIFKNRTFSGCGSAW